MTFDFWLPIAGCIAVMFAAVLYLDRRPSWSKDARFCWRRMQAINRWLFPTEAKKDVSARVVPLTPRIVRQDLSQRYERATTSLPRGQR